MSLEPMRTGDKPQIATTVRERAIPFAAGSATTLDTSFAGKHVRLRATADCYYRVDGQAAAADNESPHLEPGEMLYEFVPGGGGISVFGDGGAGSLRTGELGGA